MSTYSEALQLRLVSYKEPKVARAMAVGASHPFARLVAWAGRILSRNKVPNGPDYRDYEFFK